MIKIGINENVFLEKASLDDKNTLELVFQEVKTQAKTSLFANVAADEVVEKTDLAIKLFPPTPPKKEDMAAEKKVELVVSDINRTKGILLHILKGYFTSEDLKGVFGMNVYAGLPIDENNFNEKILVKEILEGIHKNMARLFIEKMTPFFNKREHAFRLLLVRQSKDKHYASFRGRYIDDNHFYESMQVPKEASKVKFTDYEKREGLDNDIPVSKDATADPKGGAATPAAPVTAANVFGT